MSKQSVALLSAFGQLEDLNQNKQAPVVVSFHGAIPARPIHGTFAQHVNRRWAQNVIGFSYRSIQLHYAFRNTPKVCQCTALNGMQR